MFINCWAILDSVLGTKRVNCHHGWFLWYNSLSRSVWRRWDTWRPIKRRRSRHCPTLSRQTGPRLPPQTGMRTLMSWLSRCYDAATSRPGEKVILMGEQGYHHPAISVIMQGSSFMPKALFNIVFTLTTGNQKAAISLHAISVFDKVYKWSPEKKMHL